jgi:hypothetical protein
MRGDLSIIFAPQVILGGLLLHLGWRRRCQVCIVARLIHIWWLWYNCLSCIGLCYLLWTNISWGCLLLERQTSVWNSNFLYGRLCLLQILGVISPILILSVFLSLVSWFIYIRRDCRIRRSTFAWHYVSKLQRHSRVERSTRNLMILMKVMIVWRTIRWRSRCGKLWIRACMILILLRGNDGCSVNNFHIWA